ncbi:MAG: LysR family transcriptional regulator [Pseudomonadota bacterium]
MTSPDRLSLLKTFTTVAEAGALSRAARSLNVSQPSVSRRIKTLEDLVGVRLLHRTTHQLTLTDEGARLLVAARQILTEWDAALDALSDDEPRGKLRIAAPVGLGQSRLMDEAATFVRRYPNVSIDWRLTDEMVDLIGGEADLWVRIGGAFDDRLVIIRLTQVRRYLVAAPGALSSPREWASLPFVALTPYNDAEITLYDRHGQERHWRPTIALSSDNIAAVKRAVLQDAGAALLPEWLVEQELDAGRLIRLAPSLEGARLALSVAYAPDRGRPQRLRRFIDQLTESFKTTKQLR